MRVVSLVFWMVKLCFYSLRLNLRQSYCSLHSYSCFTLLCRRFTFADSTLFVWTFYIYFHRSSSFICLFVRLHLSVTIGIFLLPVLSSARSLSLVAHHYHPITPGSCICSSLHRLSTSIGRRSPTSSLRRRLRRSTA